MRAVIQRTISGEVCVNGTVAGRLAFDSLDESGARHESVASCVGGQDPTALTGESGCEVRRSFVVLLRAQRSDGAEQVAAVARKIAELRILDGELSVADVGASIPVISQFTPYGDTREGRCPLRVHAALDEKTEPLVDVAVADLRGRGLHIETGQFGAMMEAPLVNDGPFTVLVGT